MIKAAAIVVAVALLLGGCAIFEPKVVVRRVEIPVPVPCVDAGDIPAGRVMEHESLLREDSIFDKVRAITIDLRGLQADDARLRALLVECTGR